MASSERSATDDIVSAIMGRWATAFSSLDASALASLYSRNAFFFGSNPSLYRGNDGVAAYFEGLPRWRSPKVQFTDVRTAHAAADLINVAGNHLGHHSRRRRMEDRQPSRVVEDAADRAVGRLRVS
jgi:ketosteroid isomerase-like protein